MTSWPILSVVTFLPIAGALFIAFLRDDEAGLRNARWVALWTTLTHLRDLADPGLAFRSKLGRFPIPGKAAVARRRHHLRHGGRRHFAAVRDPDHRADADLDPGELDRHPAPGARIHDRLPGARDADGRHLLRARPGAVLYLLRGRPDPDVPDHRRVGRSAPGLCELQVLSLHAARLGADAARHHGDVLGGRHHRHPDAAAPRLPARTADLGLLRLPRFVRGQAADVAGPHLAARRPCRGADGRLGDPGRYLVENGRLRLPALFTADVPGGLGSVRAADLRAVDRRHHLHLAGRADAGGREEAHRLFLGGAHGLRHHGAVRLDHAGRRRRHLSR